MNPTKPIERRGPWDVETLRQIFDGIDLPSSDGEPMDSEWHRYAMNLLIDLVFDHFAGQEFFAGGDMFLYFSPDQLKSKDFRGPDFFFVRGRPSPSLRKYWAIWEEEGRYPNVIIELTSPTTERIDRTTKYDIYGRVFRTPEYFIYDPDDETLDGFRLDAAGNYQPISADEQGRMWSEQLGLWLGIWHGAHANRRATWLRFFTAEGAMIPTAAERADAERQRADAERQRADAERQRADAEHARATAAEAELARLRAILGESPTKNGH